MTVRRLGRRSIMALAAGAAATAGTIERARADTATAGSLAGEVEIGYRAQPDRAGPFAGVIVAGDTAASKPFTAEFCRRLAEAGYFALAPDRWKDGDHPSDAAVERSLDQAIEWAGQHGADSGRVGLIGFGAGGRAAWSFAARSQALKAVVVWGGDVVAPELAAAVKAPVLGLYGAADPGNTRAALLAVEIKAPAGVTVQMIRYVGATAAFEAGSTRSDRAATLDGWQRTLAWLNHHKVT